MEWKILLTVLTFVQALVSRAATLSQTECLQYSNPNAPCIPLDVSMNPLCSQNPAVCTGSQDDAAVIDSRKKCEGGVTGPQGHQVSSLVMTATRWCGVRNFFDIHTLWNKNDSDSDYKLILKERAERYWDSTVACIYDGTRNIASFDGHSVGRYLTQVQVVTQDIDQSADMNSADVLIESSLSRVPERAVFAVYNDSDGKSCEQHYTPLTVDEYLAAAAWESDDDLVQVNVSWCSLLESEEFIVAIGSDSCTLENRSLPCFLVRNSSSVSVGPFHWPRDSNIPVRVYSVTTNYCPNARAREELVHLFRGCGETCCLSGVTVPTPESATMATASGSGILTMSSPTSPCDLGMKVPSSDDPDSIPTSSGSHSDITNTSSATPISVMQIKDWILIIVASILCTIFIVVLLILLIAIAAKCLLFSSASSKLSTQPSIISHLKDSSAVHSALEVIVHSTSSQESGKLLGSSGQESHVSTPTSVESTTPLFKDPSCTSQDRLPNDPAVHVFVVYSPSTPEKDQELIRHQFIPELQSYYDIKVQSHDFACIKESPSQWLEHEISKATAVLCVCNKEFKNDWESREVSSHSLPLVPSLKHLVHAAVQQNECLSKYAIILIEPTDKSYIPTKYLQGDPRQFSVNDVEDIVRFVRGIPSHSMSLPSSE